MAVGCIPRRLRRNAHVVWNMSCAANSLFCCEAGGCDCSVDSRGRCPGAEPATVVQAGRTAMAQAGDGDRRKSCRIDGNGGGAGLTAMDGAEWNEMRQGILIGWRKERKKWMITRI